MRAVRTPCFGGPEVLELVELPEPTPGEGEVLLAIEACGLNWSDLLQREGLYPGGPRPPFLAGQEAAGVVVAQGPGVTAPAVGARVCAIAAGGLQADRAVVRASSCFSLPDGIGAAEGAAIAVSLLTAACALTTVGRAQPGETVLVHSGAGALGTTAVQVARRLGLDVFATASTAEKRARVSALGARAVCGYEDFEEVVRHTLGDRRIDLVLDSVGGNVSRRSAALLAPFGRHLLVGLSGGVPPAIDVLKLIHQSQAVLGFHLGTLLRRPALAQEAAARFFPWVADGSVRPQVGAILPLQEIRAAHERLASRSTYGKLVLIPSRARPPPR